MDSSPVVLITAGTAGLGAAVARHFARQGFRVVVNYNSNTSRADNFINELITIEGSDGRSGDSEKSRRFVAIKADLASRDDINQLVNVTMTSMGRIDVIFSNGGWTRFRDMSSLDDNVFEEDWDRAFNINVKSHLWLMKAAKEELDKSEGAFITTASVAGLTNQGSSLVINNPFFIIMASFQ